MSETFHIVPVDDLMEHAGIDCPCLPTLTAQVRADGTGGLLATHHSLDGREQREAS